MKYRVNVESVVSVVSVVSDGVMSFVSGVLCGEPAVLSGHKKGEETSVRM